MVIAEVDESTPDFSRTLNRRFTMNSACGVCGATNISDLKERNIQKVSGNQKSLSKLAEYADLLNDNQKIFKRTGGLHAAILVNPEGQVIWSFEDVGRHNAVDKVIGAALFEEFVYSSDGNFLSGTFADYRLPTSAEVISPKIYHQETPSPFTPLGAKGIGEGNSMSTPVCIANAIADALNVEDVVLPATPSRIHAHLVAKGILKAEKLNGTRSHSLDKVDYPLKAQGQVKLKVMPEEIFAVLLDPQRLKNVIPGCESIKKTQLENGVQFDCVAVVRIGVAKARFTAKISLTNIHRPTSFNLGGEGRGPLGMALGMGQVSFRHENGVTILGYDYQAQVSGKLAAVGSR